MRKRYKVILNVEITDPDAPGDYWHKTRIEGVLLAIRLSAWRSEGFATVTQEEVIDKGEIELAEQEG